MIDRQAESGAAGATRESKAGARLGFRLLTYNIHKAIGVDRRFDPDRIGSVIRHYDPDIALLQEVDRYAPRSGRLDLASHLANLLDHRHRAVSMNVHLKQGRYGNATLTRFPISRQYHIDLTISWRKRRGAQHTRIHVRNGHMVRTVDVFNVHLGLSARERNRQVRMLLESPDVRRLGADDAVIVAGDVNDWRGLLPPLMENEGGFRFARAATGRPIRTFPSYAPTGALDRVFFRGPLSVTHVARSRLSVARVASDHLPLIVDFEFV
ncbi:MAG: endonuclease/exonuclease/phosphatase family protein [Phycisphaerales bacterium]|nr:endonuclease/exonuclease/phosphatase family protein [Phycisphaerales bacterium]